MKSPMINSGIFPDPENYSDLKILKSAAGYYIGTSYHDGSPGSRDSNYFKTRPEAEDFLNKLETGKLTTKVLRNHP